MSKRNMAIIVAVAIVVAGGGFYGGMAYAQNKKPARSAAAANFQNAAGQRGQFTQRPGGAAAARGAGGFVGGEILSKDDKSITVKMQNGSTKIVFLADSTSIGKTTEGSKDDLAQGTQVIVTGTSNSDGSVTAQNIQIRPAGMMPPAQGN